ncbi:MAG TPA: hypothetical protein VG265_14895 [Gaiellaceae bacterium]|nr:hypothetical protein [Gaiellaceae bacterium]
MDGREARKGVNEAWFRDLNERLERRSARRAAVADGFDAICECANEDCTERIKIGFADYERVRSSSTRFLLRPDHADLTVERVLSSHDEYDVVEKIGDAATVAEHEDARTAETP